jgi:hypothetical protein
MPGERPATDEQRTAEHTAFAAVEGPAGLQVVIHERGHVSHSVDGTGTNSSSSQVAPTKPAGATLRRAALFAASTGFSGPIQGAITIDGTEVALGAGTPSYIGSTNHFADVTALVRSKVDAAPAGPVLFDIGETSSPSVDGVVLALVFNDPAQTADRSVTLLFGATQTAGDQFELQMSAPLDPTNPQSILEMSLGISFGFQQNGTPQYSTVEVNSQRLTTSAGGEDDGEPANGALITVGGVGDSRANPTDANALPAGPRSDDELYDLTPFVRAGDRAIRVNTSNPSNDDNIFFAAFVTNPPVTIVVTPNPTPDLDLVALGDSYSSGEGTYTYDQHSEAQKCHRGPVAWPRYLELGVDAIARIEHKACTGEKATQLQDGYHDNPAQIDVSAPNPDVEIVTITIGGNDVGFEGIVWECYRPLSTCADVPESRNFQRKLQVLTARLVTEIYPAIRTAYPNARIVHVGYPLIVPRPGNTPVNCGWLGADEQAAAVEIAGDLNFSIQQAAFLSTEDVEFISITDVLAGHELCTSDAWVEPVIIQRRGVASEQGYPTMRGQDAIAASVAFQLGYPGYVHQS